MEKQSLFASSTDDTLLVGKKKQKDRLSTECIIKCIIKKNSV